jgi:hypothetical protein
VIVNSKKVFFSNKFLIFGALLWAVFVVIGSRNHESFSVSRLALNIVIFALPWVVADLLMKKTLPLYSLPLVSLIFVLISISTRAIFTDTFEVPFLIVSSIWSLLIVMPVRLVMLNRKKS